MDEEEAEVKEIEFARPYWGDFPSVHSARGLGK